MKKLLILYILILLSFVADAQIDMVIDSVQFTKNTPQIPDSVLIQMSKFSDIKWEIPPRIGNENVGEYVDSVLQMSEQGSFSKRCGVVVFSVDVLGNVSNVHILNSYSHNVDKKLIKIIRSLPRLKPAYAEGQNTNAHIFLQITFLKSYGTNIGFQSGPNCTIIEPAYLPDPSKGIAYLFEQKNPSFVGGLISYEKFLKNNLRYSAEAKAKRRNANVILRCVVEKDGSIDSMSVVRSPNDDFSMEALRLMHICPKLNPGKKNGVAVRCVWTMPIRFSLEDE